MDDQEIRNRVIEKMLRMRVVGAKKKRIDTVVNQAGLPSHEHGRARQLIEEMLSDPAAPIEAYGGGHRENIRLTGIDDAVEYLTDNGGNVPFNFNS